MSDLISRSALIKAMNESKKQPTSDENTEGYCEGWNDLADIINEQPTAYDVDKVVHELREVTKHNIDCYEGRASEVADYDNSWNDDIISASETIDIVRKGGVE